MNIPALVKSPRCREYNQYSPDERASVVIAYLFGAMSHRAIDKEILHLDNEYSRGYQAMGILHYLGLVNAHKGFFKPLSLQEAIQELKATNNNDFNEIIDILSSQLK